MNDFEHAERKELGDGLRVDKSPGGTAMNLFDDRYGVMIALKRAEAKALQLWLNTHLPM